MTLSIQWTTQSIPSSLHSDLDVYSSLCRIDVAAMRGREAKRALASFIHLNPRGSQTRLSCLQNNGKTPALAQI